MRKSLFLTGILSVALLGACTPTTQIQDAPQAGQLGVAESFNALLDDHWNWQLASSPTFATSLGVRDFDDRLGDPSLAAYDAEITADLFCEIVNRFQPVFDSTIPQARQSDTSR